MSLLESLVSLVILAVAAVGFLGTFQQASHSARNAEHWLRASQIAEAAMESRKAGISIPPNEQGFVTSVSEQALSAGAVDVEIAVQLPDGQRLVVHRIVTP
jgi:type II secretory pathway pseudopilin PulG